MKACPAQGVSCNNCGRTGHFAKWYMSTESQTKPTNENQVVKQKSAKPKRKYNQRTVHHVNDNELSESDEQYAFTCMKDQTNGPKISINIIDNLLPVTADSGSLMSTRTYNESKLPELTLTNVNIRPYSAQHNLQY